MEVDQRVFEYKDDEGNVFEGVLCVPKNLSGKAPGVLVHHAFGGCSDFEASKANELAKLGFVALAADVYGKGRRGTSIEENFALLKPLAADRPGALKKRLLASLAALKSVDGVDGTKIGAIGYCFGGMCALDLARHQVGISAAVSFHGTLTPLPEAPIESFPTSIQVHNGDADVHVKKEVIEAFCQEMRDRKADWSFCSYGNAVHGFTEPHADALNHPGLGYNKEADVRSWAATVAFLKEKLM